MGRLSNRTLFTGTAWHYARYRPGYPSVFFTDLVERFHLDGTGRLLDLGCGTGQLTLRLAEHVAAATGIDPEPEMLNEAARQAQAATAWQQAIEDVQLRFLPPDWQAGIPTAADGHEPHEEILARSAFRHVQQRAYQFTRTWTIERAIGYLYSTSVPLRRLLGSRRAAFEKEVTDALLAIDPAGRFTEPVTLEVLTATKR
ncbi:MAG: hypothetical protein QOF66_3293 [Mycobacterium sp.]|jgi:hypothetical protein|uniref:class I SAM-dependent methyltransferase n=1 Tax=Mycobacterium sp. TaxID=1785 RepID=UPI0028BC14B7|nr:hypothetical protein [Mycobacterium sp.]